MFNVYRKEEIIISEVIDKLSKKFYFINLFVKYEQFCEIYKQ